MAVALSPPTDEPELSKEQKYQRLREKSLVEVKILTLGGAEPKWVEARIRTTNKGGAYCKCVTGLERFFHWNEVRPSKDSFDPAKPIASLGEIARGLPALRALPPFLDVEPPTSKGRPDSVLIPIDKVRMPKPQPQPRTQQPKSTKRKKAPERRKEPDPDARVSAVGQMIYAERMRRNLNQIELAGMFLKYSKATKGGKMIFNSRISHIELGKTLPTDDELVGFAEVLKLDLDEMIEKRDQTDLAWAAAKLAAREAKHAARFAPPPAEPEPAPGAEPEPEPPPPPPPREQTLVAVPSRPAAVVAQPDAPRFQPDLAAFADGICSVSPIPTGLERRKEWFALVMQLYRLGPGE